MLGAAALAAACEALAALPEAALEVHEAALRERLVHGLTRLPGVQVHRIFDDAPSSIGVVTFTVDGFDPGLVAAYLSAEHGIGVRDGKFCAHPLLARLGLDDGAVRASVGVGSRTEDVDRLVAAVATLVEAGPGWAYAHGGRPAGSRRRTRGRCRPGRPAPAPSGRRRAPDRSRALTRLSSSDADRLRRRRPAPRPRSSACPGRSTRR